MHTFAAFQNIFIEWAFVQDPYKADFWITWYGLSKSNEILGNVKQTFNQISVTHK